MDDKDINRLMMQFDDELKKSNRLHINPLIDEMSIEGMQPIVELVARCRGAYLEKLYSLCQKYEGSENFPSAEELDELAHFRQRFVELADGAKSFETAIQRGYMDVKANDA